MSSLIDDLKDLSRLHAGAVETYLRPVDLDEVVADSLDDLGPGRQHITLSTAEDLPDVIADSAFLTRILTSLLADAWQRSPADPMPALTAVGLDEHHGDPGGRDVVLGSLMPLTGRCGLIGLDPASTRRCSR